MTTPEPNVPWPVRVIAVLFVLPFRLAWELLRLAGRVLVDYVLRPLGWLLDKLILVPLALLLRWLVVIPLRLLWEYLLGPALRFVWRYLIVIPLTWLGHQIARVVRWIWRIVVRLARATLPLWEAIGRAGLAPSRLTHGLG